MLELNDFIHLPQARSLVEQLIDGGPGLIVVAGLDARALASPGDGFLPSGRAAIYRLLMREILARQPGSQAIVVGGEEAPRPSRALRRRVKWIAVGPAESHTEAVAQAAARRPDLLVVEHLSAESATAALEAARSGQRVLSQIDTAFRGAEVARQLLDWGLPRDLLAGLAWVLAVQRVPTLCPYCKEPAPLDPAQWAELRRRLPNLPADLVPGVFCRADGCSHCRDTGRAGEMAAFDIFRADPNAADPLVQPSGLPLEHYLLELAVRGELPLDDLLHAEADRLRRIDRMLVAAERAEAEARATLDVRLAELAAANRVLEQRNKALIALEGIGQALSTSAGLGELAAQLCRGASDLCGADRSILYFLRPESGLAEVLATCGWDQAAVGQPLEAALVLSADAGPEPAPFNERPPGVTRDLSDVTSAALRAGLRVPLVAQGQPVGLMIVHTSHAGFAPGEVALLQTFANQAAVAIQRAGLVEVLQDKIAQLEAAQAELVQKERLEREMELARQVQQSVLPRIFPLVPGYTFAARNRPARRVGGDFYDVILLGAERFGVVVGDVSDKGMPAALYMALTRSLLLAEARRSDSPRAVLRNVHRLLRELGQPGLFVTVFYGVVDGPSRRLTYARAGHDRPLLLRAGEVVSLAGEGTFLGFPDLDDLHLSEEQIELRPGDRLVLYTDGLTDALAPDGQPFGLERLRALLRAHASLPPRELCPATFADLAAHQGAAEQYDDMTMLVVGVG